MSAAAPVRCPVCNGVVFALLYGVGEGKCCGRRIEAERRSLTSDVRIISVDRPPKKLAV